MKKVFITLGLSFHSVETQTVLLSHRLPYLKVKDTETKYTDAKI